MHPFKQIKRSGKIHRTFAESVNEGDLIWHRDRNARTVTVVESKGWFLQYDGKLPVALVEGRSYNIPAESWHRVIKGTGPLRITIRENNMAIKLTESRLRQIIREEAGRLNEMGRYGGGRHGMSYGYGSYGSRGDYPRGGSDEYARSNEPEIDQMFADDPYSDDVKIDILDGADPVGAVLAALRDMNERNRYGYTEADMKAAARRIAARY